MIRVFLVDDHEVVRRGIAALFVPERDIEVVGEAGTVQDALARIPAARPDVAILDGRLPDGSGIDICERLRAAGNPVRALLLTSYDDDEAVHGAVLAGAAGYLLKEVAGNRLVESVRRVAEGQSLLDPRVTEVVLRRLREPVREDAQVARLSMREREVLVLVGDGLTNRAIGEHLCLAEKTVKNYMSAILAKLQMQRRTQAAVFAVEHRDALEPNPT